MCGALVCAALCFVMSCLRRFVSLLGCSFGKEDQLSLVLYDTEHEEDLVFVSRAGLPVLQSEMADA